ncbi:hypothetical protein M231_06472 [Tremella mesenterica]|uniref:Programmed cell death protein 2 C-terminal domain-containing protein n=1 Tax=Tremella mesenterica TaxID=5217 RepID=A0A4Q1BBR8_TREME|nr:hypothetical protein M231_06472 [Tremella mesenterica]
MSPSSPSGSSTSSLPTSNTLLALPDGIIPDNHPDRNSPNVSFVAGYPTFPSMADVPDRVRCKVCGGDMPLLVQVYCPPEGGTNDRTVYIFACSRVRCQRKDGSIRAFRASKRNEDYVRDVEETRKKEEAARLSTPQDSLFGSTLFSQNHLPDLSSLSLSSINPFSSSSPQPQTSSSTPPSLSPSQPTTSPPAMSNPSTTSSQTIPSSNLSKDTSPTSPSTTITYSPPYPAYQPPQYLTTTGEYLPPPTSSSSASSEGPDDPSWKDEQWERLLRKGVDEVLQRFVARLSNAQGAQGHVLRYDLNGVPLPYSSTSKTFKVLWPGVPLPSKPEDEDELDFETYYDPSSVPRCSCGSKRVFEVQLVPTLISLLSPDTLTTTGKNVVKKKGKLSEVQRKKEIVKLTRQGINNLDEKKDGESEEEEEIGEMEWGSILVFGCQDDCEGCKEEWVEVEWEGALSLGPLPSSAKST